MTDDIDHNQSFTVDCSNCGNRGEPTGETAEDSLGNFKPVLKCQTCRAAWTTTDARLLGRCIADSTATRGVDYWAVDHKGFYPSEWAELTDRNESTVKRNLSQFNDSDE